MLEHEASEAAALQPDVDERELGGEGVRKCSSGLYS